MATRVLGPTGSRRRRRFLFVSLLLVACTALFLAGSAQAVHELQFQLDGETTSTAYSPPPGSSPAFDWNDIFNVSNDTTANTQTVSVNSNNVGSGKTFDAAVFARDFETNATCPTTSAIGLNSLSTNLCTGDDTTYATGSKDTLGVGNGGWQCNHDNNVNSKIDITNAYVVQYTNPADGHKIFYFGVERNVSNGTNDVGVWFLQSGASCTAPTGHLNFSGQHQDGDTLVVAEQTSGGGVSTAKAFRWAAAASGPLSGDGGCLDSNDNPNPAIRSADGTFGCNNLPIASGGDCKTAGSGDSICGTTNAFCTIPKGKPPATTPPCTLPWNQSVTTNWRTANGSSVGNTIVSPDFFEGGIDITKAFEGKGGNTPSCFNTIVPDTRSSASPTATLFDYTLNQLGGCGGELTTQQNFGSTSQPIGSNGTISSGTDSATLTITGTPSWGGTLTWYLCGPDVTTCNTHGVNVTSETVSSTDGGSSAGTPKAYSTADTSTSTATLTSAAGSGTYCWHAQFVPNDASKAAGVKTQDDDGTGECFTVTPLTPTLTTTAHCYDSSNNQIDSACVVGSTLKDTASLTGTANNPNNDGAGGDTGLYKSINGTTSPADSSITWTLHGPGTGGAADCTASTLIANAPTPSSVTVSGDNTSYGPVSYTTSASSGVGKYEFAASYDPTAGGTVASPNTTAPTNQVTCDTTGNNGEQVTVIGSATSSSKQGWLPNDRITINTTAGTKASGTITVTLYYGSFTGTLANCGAGTSVQKFQDLNKTVSTTTNSATFVTDNTSFFVGVDPSTGNASVPPGPDTNTTNPNYFWLIHFHSDQGLTDPPDRCESATITHADS
jgi:hypothetical protein